MDPLKLSRFFVKQQGFVLKEESKAANVSRWLFAKDSAFPQVTDWLPKSALATNEYLVVVDNYVDVAYISSGELM